MFVFVKEIFGSIFVGTVIFLGVVLMFKLFVCMYFFKGIRLYVCFGFQTSKSYFNINQHTGSLNVLRRMRSVLLNL